MEFVNSIAKIPNAFLPGPLSEDDLSVFYVKTMSVRTGDEYVDPIDDIYNDCANANICNQSYLLLGNRGCGKSTELGRLSKDLKTQGFHVTTIMCESDLDIKDPLYSDLLILVGYTLLKIADETHCHLSRKSKDVILHFWEDIDKTEEISKSQAGEIEAAISLESPLSALVKAIGLVKTSMCASQETRVVCRKSIQKRATEWIDTLNQISEKIFLKCGKPPVVIFEDLDKLHSEGIFNIFYNEASKLATFHFPVIYTFPSAFSFSKQFANMSLYFSIKYFPMIQLEFVDGSLNEEAFQVIREIVFKRANKSLFDERALQIMIEKTGGALRALFRVIVASSQRARRRRCHQIQIEDAKSALKGETDMMTRRIQKDDCTYLAEVYHNKGQVISDSKRLLELLSAGAILDHSGWHNVHPLIIDYLKEQKVIYDE